jgi:endonuclease/exonuclease/phosphatase family metal-dependent hydrolase
MTVPHHSADVSVISWNVAEYIRPGKAEDRAPHVEQALRDERPAIALLQEIYAPNREEAVERVQALADKVGLDCELPDGRVAMAYGSKDMHAAILWDTDQNVVPDASTWRFYGLGELWHAMVLGTVTIEDVPLTVASYHAPSLDEGDRIREAKRIMFTATSGFTRAAKLYCGDFNGISNARKATGEYYDSDPYDGKPDAPEQVFQVDWTETADGRIVDRHVTRRVAEILSFGGLLHDVAPGHGEEWKPTIGHWYPDGPHGLRRVDQAWATLPVLRAIRSCTPIDTEATTTGSDHLPLKTVLNVEALRDNLHTLAAQAAS